MSRFFLLILSGIILQSCEKTPNLKTIDFTKEQMDILFVSQTEGVEEIFTVRDTTPNEIWVILLASPYGVLDPSWSKDGRKFAYSSKENVTFPFGSFQYDIHTLDHYLENAVYRQELVIYLKEE